MRQSTDDTVYCYHTQCPNINCEHHASHIHEFYVFRKYDYFKECQYWDLPETYYSCDSCEHDGKLWGEEPCDSCCGNHSGYVGVPDAQPETHDKRTETHACDLISRQAAIDTEGLDEQIRCEICRNPMHTDRGCDGNCKYDEKLYERIMQILGERIKPLPSVQPDVPDTNVGDTIYRQAAIDAIECVGYDFSESGLSNPELEELCEAIGEVEQDMIMRIRHLPSAQPDIIRCKDCKHKPSGSGANHDISFPDEVCPCRCEDYWYSWMPKDNRFCGSWERREDERSD